MKQSARPHVPVGRRSTLPDVPAGRRSTLPDDVRVLADQRVKAAVQGVIDACTELKVAMARRDQLPQETGIP